jgi:membrane protein
MAIIPFATLSLLIFDFIQNLFFPALNWKLKVTEMLADEMIHIIPFISREWVKTHVVNPGAYSSFKAINFLMLPIISGLIFKSLETSYRKIFELPPRHLVLGQAVYIIMSIFTVLLFFISNFIWIILSTSFCHILNLVNRAPYLENFYHVARSYIISQPINLISALVLIVFYLVTVKLFLNIKIRIRYQILAAFIFCILWIVARKFFGLYIQHISELNLLYGSLSSVIVILMWIFYSSIALLFSVEVMYMLHSGSYYYLRW